MTIFRSTRRDGTDNAANRRATVAAGYLPVCFALAATQTALASLAAIEQPTMAATLTRMERDGLIHRRPDPPGRTKLADLSHASGPEQGQRCRSRCQHGQRESFGGVDRKGTRRVHGGAGGGRACTTGRR